MVVFFQSQLAFDILHTQFIVSAPIVPFSISIQFSSPCSVLDTLDQDFEPRRQVVLTWDASSITSLLFDLRKFFNPHFSYLYVGDNTNICFMILLLELNDTIHIKYSA
jgi:hypothetical protein